MDMNVTGTPSLIQLIPPEMTRAVAESMVNRMIVSNPELEPFRDELVDAMDAQLQGLVTYAQTTLDNLQGGDPVLADPLTINVGNAELVNQVNGNPWLAANPYATFFLLFLELCAEMSKIKMNEGIQLSEMTNLVMDMAMDQAQIIKNIYEIEAKMNIASAICNAVGGALTIGFGAVGIAKWKTSGMAWSTVGTGLGQLASSAEKSAHAIFTLERAGLEFTKTIMEHAIRVLQDRGLGSAAEAYKTADDIIAQVLQALTKMIDEAYKAHGFQIH